ncbi:protein-disulfide reductase DsbD N-terminal domain-containing protein [Delftia tsuruhatensis]|uniref:protein-disulfide reductase DsbD N-terminal domain-containing protein n=1 Tax=Delftia tsuruhatensis TaxID=180282 RepID=UPI0028ACB1BE|nr:protein-disulfide reductase DsbD domain-containing protein [Delftia tsuruhatensis]
MSISVLRSALLSLLLLVGTTGSIASNWSSWPHQSRATEPLSAEHVFTLTPVQAVGSKPTVTGNIASNHYIYRTSLKAEDAAGNPVELQLPAGVIHEDEFFGKTEVYESSSISIGFVNTAAQEVTLHWQGCATSGNRLATANTILVATGGRPDVPAFPGNELAITSDQLFHLSEQPKRVPDVNRQHDEARPAGRRAVPPVKKG